MGRGMRYSPKVRERAVHLNRLQHGIKFRPRQFPRLVRRIGRHGIMPGDDSNTV